MPATTGSPAAAPTVARITSCMLVDIDGEQLARAAGWHQRDGFAGGNRRDMAFERRVIECAVGGERGRRKGKDARREIFGEGLLVGHI